MIIKIDNSPTTNDHKERGIGSYTRELIKALEKRNAEHIITTEDVADYDLIHYPYYDLFTRSPILSGDTPSIVTLHDLIPIKFSRHFPIGIRGRFKWFMQKLQLRKAAAILTDSDSSKRDILQYCGVPEEKVHVIHLAASEEYKPVKQESKIVKVLQKYNIKMPYILYVGDINWNKNVNGLVEAFSYVHKKYSNINLVLVSKALKKDTVQSRQIYSTITTNTLSSAVTIPGFVDQKDLPALYSGAEMYVQPSFYEGFGLPVLEAMRCGTIVVSSREGSLEEIGAGASVFTDPYNTKQIANDIEKVLTMNQTEKKDIKHKSIKHAQQLTWEETANKTLNIYQDVLKQNEKTRKALLQK